MKAKLYALLASVWTAITFGQATKASSLPVTMASDQDPLKVKEPGDYETVAASQSNQVLGGNGAVGDYLHRITLVPVNTAPGNVSVRDGTAANISVFVGGANAVLDTRPIQMTLGMTASNGPLSVNTGANVSVIATGKFT